LIRDGQTNRDILAAYLDDPASRWSLGGFGAGAEFGHVPGEPVVALEPFGRVTPRGALRLELSDDLVPVAYETGFRGGWSHVVALCRPEATALVRGADGIVARGPDAGAARPEDRDAPLFDLGLDLPQGWAALRTRDPHLVARLQSACGGVAFAPGSPVPGLLADRRVDVVMMTPLGRIEVFAGILPAAGGPRAYIVQEVMRLRRTHAATAPIPPGLVPCAHLHPPHSLREADGRPIPFDRHRHDAFQALLARWGDSDAVALKARLRAGDALARDADRRVRALARVVAAQATWVSAST
jgi:hypothetical protein